MEARQVSAALSAMRNKTDKNDARGIAQLVCSGWCNPVHMKGRTSHLERAPIPALRPGPCGSCDRRDAGGQRLRLLASLPSLCIACGLMAQNSVGLGWRPDHDLMPPPQPTGSSSPGRGSRMKPIMAAAPSSASQSEALRDQSDPCLQRLI